MAVSYWRQQDGILTVNYAAQQDGVILYPDLVKLQFSMANGLVVGLEAGNYLRNHVSRALPLPLVSEEQAMAQLNLSLIHISQGLREDADGKVLPRHHFPVHGQGEAVGCAQADTPGPAIMDVTGKAGIIQVFTPLVGAHQAQKLPPVSYTHLDVYKRQWERYPSSPVSQKGLGLPPSTGPGRLGPSFLPGAYSWPAR